MANKNKNKVVMNEASQIQNMEERLNLIDSNGEQFRKEMYEQVKLRNR